jgi:hypothetical protein
MNVNVFNVKKGYQSKNNSKNFLSNEVDDFWEDCLKLGEKTNGEYITFSEKANKNKDVKNLTKNPSNVSLSNSKSNQKNLLERYYYDKLWTPEELIAKHREEERKKKAIERCFLMYEKGKIKNEVNRIMYHKNEELKVQNELKECTWKPKLFKISKKLEKNLQLLIKGTKIYNRSMIWKNKQNEKINRSRSENNREELDKMHKPKVLYHMIINID